MIRLLLDENLPRRLASHLDAHVATVPRHGWGGLKNGRLIELAAEEFDAMMTMDKGMEYQQNMYGIDLCLIVLSAPSNDIDDLLPLVPKMNASFASAQPGTIIRIDSESVRQQLPPEATPE